MVSKSAFWVGNMQGQRDETRGMRNRRENWRHEYDLLNGNLVIVQLIPTDIWQRARVFGKMDLKSSFQGLRVPFTSIKRNFFQKVAFYIKQTDFLDWLFSKHAFWAEKVETKWHLIIVYFPAQDRHLLLQPLSLVSNLPRRGT